MLAAVLALRLLAAGPEEASDEEASRRFAELIDAAANRGEFDSALRLVDEAERLYPHHRWHFFRAAILSETGECQAAVAEYDAYLAAETVPANVRSATQGRKACADEIAAESKPDPEPPPPPALVKAPEPEPAPAPDRPRASWARDPAAIALLTSGLVGVGAGAILYIQAVRKRDAAENAGGLEQFESDFATARRLGVAGIVTLAVGAALVVGGAVRFGVLASRHRRDTALTFRF